MRSATTTSTLALLFVSSALLAALGTTSLRAQTGISVNGDRVITGGVSCPDGQSLVGFLSDGTPQCVCGPGRTQCTTCTDLETDNQNCGACGNVCANDVACVDGLCRACDVAAQDCPSPGDACYYAASTPGSTLCAPPVDEPGTQGDACSFLNGCDEGLACLLPNDPSTPTGSVCTSFCDPARTFPQTGDAFCATQIAAGARCVRLADFYVDVTAADRVAICVGAEFVP